jgi:glycosyltransferase involved in cell wall biosynthesis
MNLLIFEPEISGHHPGYLRHLLHYWPKAETHLIFVVSPEFAQRHLDVMQTPTQATVTWQPMTAQELRWYEQSKRSVVRHVWVEWRLYCRYAKTMQADQGLIMYMDRFQLPLALRLVSPCPMSGIFFRPKFHYRQLNQRQPTAKERLSALREQWLWRSALRHPQLKTLFCLDPFAVEPLRALGGHTPVVHLPDPVEIYPQSAAAVTTLRQTLGIDPARKILLLFGMIDRRKGIYQVLEAVQQLGGDHQAQLTLLLVGPLAEVDKANVLAQIDTITQDSAVQIVVCDDFVPDTQIQAYFDIADLVLALYQRHVGMSAILVRAAAAGKPVLASDYGLMGELVQRHQLGFVVDSSDATAIATKVRHFFEQPTVSSFVPTAAVNFARENSAAAFVQLLWEESGKLSTSDTAGHSPSLLNRR